MTTPDFDLAICGAGPVGLTLAALLVKQGMRSGMPARIALIDGKTVEQTMQDPRSIALSYGSRQILEALGAWPIATDAIHQIHVSRRGHFGRTLIDRQDYKLPALGYVTPYNRLVSTLTQATNPACITVLRPVQVMNTHEVGEAVELELSDNSKLTASIVVQAEGGVFIDQTPKSLRRDYEQVAIVAHVKVTEHSEHRAFERFTDEGPLALLPEDDGYSLVWCVRPDTAERIAALPDSEFLTALEQMFGTRLGQFTSTTRRATFPLGLNAQPKPSQRIVSIGNAAQTLHPVAGQGLNIGLRDAAVLARQLSQEATPSMLHRFAQTRKFDRSLTIRLTDTLARVFTSEQEDDICQTLLGMSLGLVDTFQPVKKVLAEQMIYGWR